MKRDFGPVTGNAKRIDYQRAAARLEIIAILSQSIATDWEIADEAEAGTR